MKLNVDPEVCIGCELCKQSCPEVFRMEDGYAAVYVTIIPMALEDTCRKAIAECSAGAISRQDKMSKCVPKKPRKPCKRR